MQSVSSQMPCAMCQAPGASCQVTCARCQVPCASCQVHLKWDLYKSPPPTYGQVGGSYMRCVRRKPKKCHHVLLVCGIITLTTLQCLRLSHQFLILSWGEIFAKLVFCSKKGTRDSRKKYLMLRRILMSHLQTWATLCKKCASEEKKWNVTFILPSTLYMQH